jgi:hypothetical protein
MPRSRAPVSGCGTPDPWTIWNYESGGQEFESLRARHLTLSNQNRNRCPLDRRVIFLPTKITQNEPAGRSSKGGPIVFGLRGILLGRAHIRLLLRRVSGWGLPWRRSRSASRSAKAPGKRRASLSEILRQSESRCWSGYLAHGLPKARSALRESGAVGAQTSPRYRPHRGSHKAETWLRPTLRPSRRQRHNPQMAKRRDQGKGHA